METGIAEAGWRARLRRRLVSYAAAVAINIELVVGPPRTSLRASEGVVAWNLAEPLVDGIWSRRELLMSRGDRRVAVCDLDTNEGERGYSLEGFSPN